MRTSHGSCLDTSASGGAKRLECVCFSTALVWPCNEERAWKAAVNRRTPNASRLGSEASRGDCHNGHRPNGLDTLDSAAPRNHSGALLRLPRMRDAG